MLQAEYECLYDYMRWAEAVPYRIPNPDYVPCGDKLKTILVYWEGCAYEPLKQAHTTIAVSCLDHKNKDGDIESYEIAAPTTYYAANCYFELS